MRAPELPVAAYGMATAATTLVAALLAVAWLPDLVGPCVLGALSLGVLHALAHDGRGRLLETLGPLSAVSVVATVLGVGLAEIEPHAFPLAMVTVAAQATWFGTFAALLPTAPGSRAA